jgi:cobalt-zinc-cadmium efflux system membrane fusion protein
MEKLSDIPAGNLVQKYAALPLKVRASIVVACVIVGGLLTYHLLGKAELRKPTAAVAVPGAFHPTKEQFEALKIVPVQSIIFRSEQITDGNIASNDDTTTQVFSPYSGHVTKLIAKLGDEVSKGSPLMSVEAAEYVQGQNDLISAAANVTSMQAQYKLAQAVEQRQHDLLLAKAGAQKDWLQSQSDLATAESNLRSAEIALGAARNRLKIMGKSDEEISALGSASIDNRMNPEAIVRSPISGTVILRQVGLGQNIQSVATGAANPVYAIANLSTVWLIANVREIDSTSIKVGAPIEVNVLAVPDRIFKAKITWIAPAIDSTSHRLPVRAEIANRDGALKPAMFATFRIVTGESSNSPGVPDSAIVFEGADAHVFVADEGGNIMLRPIQIGRTNDGMVEVTDGLKVGERIVTSGALFIDRALQGN